MSNDKNNDKDNDIPYYNQPHCLTTPPLELYCEKYSSPATPLAHRCEKETNKNLKEGFMLVGQLEYQFLNMLARLNGAKRVLEIGCYTGYSAIAFSDAVGKDGKVITVDNFSDEPESETIAYSILAERKNIQIIKADALETLNTLVAENAAPFDIIFIDADKERQIQYYETIISNRLLEPTKGLLVTDNALWYGRVCDPQKFDELTKVIHEFNEHVANDTRTKQCLLTVRDGLNLCMMNLDE